MKELNKRRKRFFKFETVKTTTFLKSEKTRTKRGNENNGRERHELTKEQKLEGFLFKFEGLKVRSRFLFNKNIFIPVYINSEDNPHPSDTCKIIIASLKLLIHTFPQNVKP